jgi:hypothetical protein
VKKGLDMAISDDFLLLVMLSVWIAAPLVYFFA